MGLDTSHGCWHGPYSAFTRFRNYLAEAAGYKVEPVKHDDGFIYQTAQIDWEAIAKENPQWHMGEWRTQQSDPLIYLIAHSDCEGVIYPPEAAALADRLEELMPKIPTHAGMDQPRAKAEQFVQGLRAAVAANEPVDFH